MFVDACVCVCVCVLNRYGDRVSFSVINGEEYHSWLYYTFGVSEMTALPHYILYEPVDSPRVKQFPISGEAAKNRVAISEEHVRSILERGLDSDAVEWRHTGDWARAKDIRDKVLRGAGQLYSDLLRGVGDLKKRLLKTEL